jgi:hypothetical protein
MRNEPPTLPDGRDVPFARELGWTDPQPPRSAGSYPDAFQATQRDGCDVARYGRAFWSECAAAYHSIRPADLKDVVARFRKGDEDHLGACLELFSARLLPTLGIELEAPDLDAHNPDFVTSLGSTRTLVECKVSTALDDSVADGSDIKTHVLNEIRSFEFDGLYVDVHFTGLTNKTPSLKPLRREFDRWRSSLVIPAGCAGRLADSGVLPLVFPFDPSMSVTISASYYMGADRRGGVGCIHGDAVFCGKIYEKARDGAREKSRKYKDHPLLLVLGASSSFADLDDLFEALFGPERYTIGIDRATGEIRSASASRGVSGAIFDRQPKYTNVVGALLVARHIGTPWGAKVALVPNPFTAFHDARMDLERVLESLLGKGDVESWTIQQMADGLDLDTLLAVPPVARLKCQRIRLVNP